MRSIPVKRYALARSATTGKPRADERVRRLRLVRMEAIAAAEREGPGGDPDALLGSNPHVGVGKIPAEPAKG